MDLTTIATDLADRVLTITLDRPDRLNAFTVPMQRELCAVLDEVDAEPRGPGGGGHRARAAASAPGPTWPAAATPSTSSAGSPATGGGDAAATATRAASSPCGSSQCTKPVIAAINGPAVGVGATMTLPMDIRLASESARFGFVFARRGLVPEACSSWFLPRVVGINTALEWTITGRVFDAQEALDRGLVRSIHAARRAAAGRLRAGRGDRRPPRRPTSVAMTRQMLWRMLGESHPMAAHRVDSPAIASLGRSADVREGVMSFLEKRPPAVHRPGPRRPPAALALVGRAGVLTPRVARLRAPPPPRVAARYRVMARGTGGSRRRP